MARQAAQGAPTGAEAGATVEFKIHLRVASKGRRRLRNGGSPTPIPILPGRIPRVARLMALAIHFDKLIRQGAVRDYADLARLGSVTRARISQIMDLLNLAPAIQEAILLMPRSTGRDIATERRLRGIVAEADWSKQMDVWDSQLSRFEAMTTAYRKHRCALRTYEVPALGAYRSPRRRTANPVSATTRAASASGICRSRDLT